MKKTNQTSALESLGFQDINALVEGLDNTLNLYEAFDSEDEKKYWIKKVSPTEFDFFQTQNSTNILFPIKTKEIENEKWLFFDNIEGENLISFLNREEKSIENHIEVVLLLINIIDELSTDNFLLNIINPQLVWVQKNQNKLYYLNTARISVNSSDKIDIKNLQSNELPYLAPEQTSKIQRKVDIRADFYSLGVLIYQIITGEYPYHATDTLSWIHAHVALPMKPISEEIAKNIGMLVPITEKLLSKNPDNRYQSTRGIQFDLQLWLKLYRSGQPQEVFELQTKDQVSKLNFQEGLYGRKEETFLLQTAWNDTKEGKSQLILLGGKSGTGKSALVNELHKEMIAQNHGMFLEGKFEQVGERVAFRAFRQMFESLTFQLLSKPQEELHNWQSKFQKELGKSAAVLVQLEPTLVNLLGEQETPPELEPQSARNRLHLVVKRFLNTLASPENPVLLFIDDCQWVDDGSLSILEEIISHSQLSYITLVTSYRNDEVDYDHPFWSIMSIWKSQENQSFFQINDLILTPLTENNIEELLKDNLSENLAFIPQLSKTLYTKTNGNAMFLKQMLLNLYEERVIYFNPSANTWKLNQDALEKIPVVENAVSLIQNKVKNLSDTLKNILQYAACIGNSFKSKTLINSFDLEETELQNYIREATQEGFIFKTKISTSKEKNYRFTHDNIQQAFYEQITIEERAKIYRSLADTWLKEWKQKPNNALLIDVANAYILAAKTIIQSEEIYEVAQLLKQASENSRLTAAYSRAKRYAEEALKLLPENSWQTHYELMRDIHRAIIENAYNQQEETEALIFIKKLLENVKNNQEKLWIYEIQTRYYRDSGDFEKSLAIGREALKSLNVKIPQPTKLNVIKSILISRWKLKKIGIDGIRSLPTTTNQEDFLKQKLISDFSTTAYFYDKMLLVTSGGVQFNRFLKDGLTAYSPFAILSFALNLSIGLGDIVTGYELALLSRALDEKLKSSEALRCKADFMFPTFFLHWKENTTLVLEQLRNNYKNLMEIGDFEFASYAAMWILKMGMVSDVPLKELSEEAEKLYETFTVHYRQEGKHYEYVCSRLFIALAREQTSKIKFWDDIPYSEEKLLDFFEQQGNKNAMWSTYFAYLTYHIHLNHQDLSFEYYNKALPLYKETSGMVDLPIFYVYEAIILVDSVENNKSELKPTKKIITKSWKKIKKWADFSEDIFQSKSYVIQAELARLDSNFTLALSLYQQAIPLFEKQTNLGLLALVYERVADFCKNQDLYSLANFYYKKTNQAYKKWGFVKKLDQLSSKIDTDFLSESAPLIVTEQVDKHVTNNTSLDLLSLIKNLQAISTVTALEKLLQQMLEVMLENIGGQRGIVFYNHPKGLQVIGSVNYLDNFRNFERYFFTESHQSFAPHMILNWVSRSKQKLGLENPIWHLQFGQDHYIKKQKPLSILGLPLLKQGELIGIIYMEHFGIAGIFPEEESDILELLASQLAISLESAMLYDDLESKVKERTQEVQEQHQLIQEQKIEIERQNKELTSSITYAQRIQRNIMRSDAEIQRLLPQHFIYFKPRDIVSGDFYWIRGKEDKIYVASVDCTGHGVPGAMMSMISSQLLDEALDRLGQEATPAKILDMVQNRIMQVLPRENAVSRDGMDTVLVEIDKQAKKLTFAGAHSPLIYIQNREAKRLKGDPISIEGGAVDKSYFKNFTDKDVPIFDEKGELIETYLYFTSDGFQDQFGGSEGRKFTVRRLMNLLLENHQQPLEQQYNRLDEKLMDWMFTGDEQQIDDILLIGVKIDKQFWQNEY